MIVRVVLDTCVIRHYIHGHVGLDLAAIKSSAEELRLSLAGGTGIELLAQLVEGRLTWSDWSSRIPDIDSVLDRRWPLLPTGRQLAALAGRVELAIAFRGITTHSEST